MFILLFKQKKHIANIYIYIYVYIYIYLIYIYVHTSLFKIIY